MADPVRRARAGVPEDVVFKTKPQIALDQIRAARAEGVPEGVVLADAGYGINTAFRAALTRMGLTYVVGVQSSVRLWPPGAGPLPPKAWTGQGRTPDADAARHAEPASVGPSNSPSRCRLTPGGTSHGAKASTKRFVPASPLCGLGPRIATTGVRTPMPKSGCSSNGRRTKARRPNTGSSLAADTAFARLVETAKLRWRIERDYQELKQELGLDHYEGRGLARLSPPHGALRRSLRIAGLRTEFDFPPLRRQNPRQNQNVSPIQRFSAPRIPRSAQNATSNRPSQASALGWPELSPGDCPDAPVAKEPTCDTVRLAGC